MDTRRAIETLLKGSTHRAQEAEILALLRQSSDAELDLLMGALDLSRLLSAMDDRKVGPRHYTETLTLLTQKRLSALSPRSRARLVDALQVGRTHQQAEMAILNIFLATRGDDLSTLKDAVDTGADHRDLIQLIFHDIDDGQIQQKMLDHLKAHSPKPDGKRLKVLSDIDDTFYANWKDQRYPSKTIYPGVRAFYRALARPGWDAPGLRSRITFITARPQDRMGLVEGITHEHLRDMGLDEITVLAGSFANLHSNEAIAERKVQNFKRYARLFGENEFIFVGDSGQGDAILAREMKKHLPQRVRATFIHDVVNTGPAQRQEWEKSGVFFFDTYVGAAVLAHGMDLMDDASLLQVGKDAVTNFRALKIDDPAKKSQLVKLMVRDLAALRAVVGPQMAATLPAF